MATGTIYAAVPAVVAAVGFYFIGTNYAKVRKAIMLYIVFISALNKIKIYITKYINTKVQNVSPAGIQKRNFCTQSKHISRSERTSEDSSEAKSGTTT